MITTVPSPSDQEIPVRRPASLTDLALSALVAPEYVGAYLRGSAAYLTSAYRFVRSDCGLQQVQS